MAIITSTDDIFINLNETTNEDIDPKILKSENMDDSIWLIISVLFVCILLFIIIFGYVAIIRIKKRKINN